VNVTRLRIHGWNFTYIRPVFLMAWWLGTFTFVFIRL
jgi:hypothetical protein